MLKNLFEKKKVSVFDVLDSELRRLHNELRSTVMTPAQYQIVMQEISKLNDKVVELAKSTITQTLTVDGMTQTVPYL